MISDWLMVFGTDFGLTFLTTMPSFPQWESLTITAGNYLLPLAAGMASMGVWIPWGVIGICMGIIGPLYTAALVFKLARAVLAHVPLVGGNG